MFDDLEAHFLEGVLPAYSSFIESLKSDTAGLSSDLRLGKDAALALFHLREHVPWAKGKPWPVFLTACPEFVLLQDIVNVFKHGPRRDGQVAKPTDIYETTVMTDYEDSDGTYHHAEKEVTIQLRDGSATPRVLAGKGSPTGLRRCGQRNWLHKPPRYLNILPSYPRSFLNGSRRP